MSKANLSKKNYIIGGPARNGKTILADSVYKNKKSIVGLPVEGLLNIFYKRFYPFKKLLKNVIVEDYVFWARYTNQARTEKHAPIDYMSSSQEEIVGALPVRLRNQLEVIFGTLNVFAKDNGALNWAVCDLHSERLYEIYRSYTPNLHQIVMLRNPIEAVCANGYWRTYPERPKDFKKRFHRAIIAWVFSSAVYLRWKELYPNDVTALYFNNLIDPDSEHSQQMSEMLDVPADCYKKMFDSSPCGYEFRYENGKFLAPSGKLEALLSKEEIATIYKYVQPWMNKCFPDVRFEMQLSDKENVSPLEDESFQKLLDDAVKIASEDPMKGYKKVNLFYKESFSNLNFVRSEIIRYLRMLKKYAMKKRGNCLK